jgi:hypothetical protein
MKDEAGRVSCTPVGCWPLNGFAARLQWIDTSVPCNTQVLAGFAVFSEKL